MILLRPLSDVCLVSNPYITHAVGHGALVSLLHVEEWFQRLLRVTGANWRSSVRQERSHDCKGDSDACYPKKKNCVCRSAKIGHVSKVKCNHHLTMLSLNKPTGVFSRNRCPAVYFTTEYRWYSLYGVSHNALSSYDQPTLPQKYICHFHHHISTVWQHVRVLNERNLHVLAVREEAGVTVKAGETVTAEHSAAPHCSCNFKISTETTRPLLVGVK